MFTTALIITIILFICASALSIKMLFSDDEKYIKISKIIFPLSVLFFLLLGAAWINYYIPGGFADIVSSIWGYFYIMSLLLLLIVLYFVLRKWKTHWKSIIAFSGPFIALILLVSIPFMDSTRKITIDFSQMTLAKHLLPVHVIMAIIAELLFFFSFVGSILYLVMERQLRKKTSMKLIYHLPNLESIDIFNKWTISRSLVFLTIGVSIGMVMAMLSFNKIFLGTAKEMHIYFSWVIILCIFIIRKKMNIGSHKASIINTSIFIIVMFLFIFTNIFITKGFHGFK